MKVFYRYAKALFRIQESEELDQALSGFDHLIHGVPQLTKFLMHPQIDRHAKIKILQACIPHLPLLVRFLTILIERKHVKHLSEISQEYHRLLLEKTGIIEAKLVTKFPMDEELTTRLKTHLENTMKRSFHIQTTLDPTLIGGALIFIGNRLVDYSFKGRLQALKNDLSRGTHAP